MSWPSELTFAAYCVYSPRGKSDLAKESRRIRDVVKLVQLPRFNRLLDHLAHNATGLREVLGRDVTLVPAPRSAPIATPHTLWPGRSIADGLVARRLGARVLPLLERTERVGKSAWAAPGERVQPVDHYRTMKVLRGGDALFDQLHAIVIVDDIVTRGAMLFAAARRLRDHFPSANISAFALIRTQSSGDLAEIVSPCVGRITGSDSSAARSP